MRASILVLLAFVCPARAQPPDDPALWLRQTYELYARAEKNPDLLKDSAETLAERRASRRFKALLDRDLACEIKTHEICAIDWDFIVNGQDWALSHVEVGPLQASGPRGIVTVTFVNMKSTNRNVYEFVREDGAWKLDDVVTGQRGRPQMSVSIARLLRDYKF